MSFVDKKGHYIFLGHNLMISVTVLAHCAPAHALVSRLVRWLCSAKLSASQRAQPSLNTVGFSRISLRFEILLIFHCKFYLRFFDIGSFKIIIILTLQCRHSLADFLELNAAAAACW